MRTLLVLTAAALLALPLVAEETKSNKTATPAPAADAQPATTSSQARVIQTPPTTVQDSPLVAAAKRANRLGKSPKHVITNETLKTSSGHFTMANQAPEDIVLPQPQNDPQLVQQRLAEERARQQRAADEAARRRREQELRDRERRSAEAAAAAADPYDGGDPARYEQMAEEAAKGQQQQQPPH